MKSYKAKQRGRELNSMSGGVWLLFEQECAKAELKKTSPLFRQMMSEYERLVDEEFGVGTFTRFQQNQKRIAEYSKTLPRVEFYTEGRFLLPRTVKEEDYEKGLWRKILKERLAKDGAFELRAQINNSTAREKIRSKYGMVIDFMCMEMDMAGLELSAEGEACGTSKRGRARGLFFRMTEAKMRGEDVMLQVMQEHFPGLYGAFLLLFRATA